MHVATVRCRLLTMWDPFSRVWYVRALSALYNISTRNQKFNAIEYAYIIVARTEISSSGMFKVTIFSPSLATSQIGFLSGKMRAKQLAKVSFSWWCWGHQDSPGLPGPGGLSIIFQQFQNPGQGFFANLQTFLDWCCPHLKSFLYLCLSVPCCSASQS